ncbi:MAG TPA: MdtA/MuxA family multidrug efflux RND transporter periplasmic adaptor subunit [Candidatus Sulfotelmatobacter sp.]|jgi:multidrug efflux system membrane fusion protein
MNDLLDRKRTATKRRVTGIWDARVPTILILAAVCAFFVGCSSGADPKQQKAQAAGPHAVSVATAPVQQKDVPVYLSGLGAVTAFNTANIKSRVDGQIMKVNFQEGQTVKEGDLLIEIDPRPYQASLDQMQAQLFRDQAQLRDAKLNLERYTTLIPSGSIAQQQVDTQKALVDQLDGTVRTDQAQIETAKLNIVYCHITAPFTGRVGLRQVDPGNIIHATDTNPMLILTQLQPIAVIFTLPEDVLSNVSKKMHQGTLEVDAFSRDDQTKLATGKLLTIDNEIDPTTGTAKLKAVFDNKDNQLWPNQFVNADLLLETRKKSTVVPTAAILRGPQGTFVYTVNPDKTVQDKAVTISLTQGDTTVITEGVNPGDMVVTDGQDKLQRGSKIEMRGATPSARLSGGRGVSPIMPPTVFSGNSDEHGDAEEGSEVGAPDSETPSNHHAAGHGDDRPATGSASGSSGS